MKITELLENFEDDKPTDSLVEGAGFDALEDLKLKSFESGYSAGWEDAIKAQRESGKSISEALRKSLLDIKFSREKTLQSYLKSSEPFFAIIIEKILPDIINMSIPHHIVNQLQNEFGDHIDQQVLIQTSREDLATVEGFFSTHNFQEYKIRADENLLPGQVTLGVEKSEKQIDLSQMTIELTTACNTFLYEKLGG